MGYDYAKCLYGAAELNGKTVSVRIPGHLKSAIYDGDAKFAAIQNERGQIRLAITYPVWEKDWSKVTAVKFYVPSEAFDKIVKNPKSSKCEFSLNMIGDDFNLIDDPIDPYDWDDNRFTVEDLNGKTVEFSFRDESGQVYSGNGFLDATPHGKAIQVLLLRPDGIPKNPSMVPCKTHRISAIKSRNLIRNPAGSKKAFSFIDL